MSEDGPEQAYEANPLLRVLYRRFFDAIQVDRRWVDQVQRLAEQGSIVYVLRSLNVIDLLALDHLTKRFDLPRVRYANDLRMGLLQPIGGGLFSRLATRADPTVALSDALVAGGSAALFLKRPPSMLDVAKGGSHGRGLSEGDPLIQALIELQRHRGTPILLVPQVFVWTNRPDTQGSNWLDPFFGPREWPSSVRTIGQFLYNYRHVELKAGEPFDLQAYLESAAPRSDAGHVRHIVHAMLRRLERERRSTGPIKHDSNRGGRQTSNDSVFGIPIFRHGSALSRLGNKLHEILHYYLPVAAIESMTASM